MVSESIRPVSLVSAATPVNRDKAMKFGYFFDKTGNWQIQPEEATVVRLVLTRYVHDHKSGCAETMFRWR